MISLPELASWWPILQKLTLFVPEDIYNGLHRQVGKGKISHFVSEKVRPYLLPEKTGSMDAFHGLLKKHAKTVSTALVSPLTCVPR